MPLRKIESRLPDSSEFVVENLGFVDQKGICTLVCDLDDPLIISLESASLPITPNYKKKLKYTVFINDTNSANFNSYLFNWYAELIYNDETTKVIEMSSFVNNNSSYIEIIPAIDFALINKSEHEIGKLCVKVDISGLSNTTCELTHIIKNVFPLNKDFYTNRIGAFNGNRMITELVTNDYFSYILNAINNRNIPITNFCSIIYLLLLGQYLEDNRKNENSIADKLNISSDIDSLINDFSEGNFGFLGFNIKVIGEYMPYFDLQGLDQTKIIDFFNLIRFPKSAILMMGDLFIKVRNKVGVQETDLTDEAFKKILLELLRITGFKGGENG
jgi:hypothetical protein